MEYQSNKQNCKQLLEIYHSFKQTHLKQTQSEVLRHLQKYILL